MLLVWGVIRVSGHCFFLLVTLVDKWGSLGEWCNTSRTLLWDGFWLPGNNALVCKGYVPNVPIAEDRMPFLAEHRWPSSSQQLLEILHNIIKIMRPPPPCNQLHYAHQQSEAMDPGKWIAFLSLIFCWIWGKVNTDICLGDFKNLKVGLLTSSLPSSNAYSSISWELAF